MSLGPPRSPKSKFPFWLSAALAGSLLSRTKVLTKPLTPEKHPIFTWKNWWRQKEAREGSGAEGAVEESSSAQPSSALWGPLFQVLQSTDFLVTKWGSGHHLRAGVMRKGDAAPTRDGCFCPLTGHLPRARLCAGVAPGISQNPHYNDKGSMSPSEDIKP